MKVVKFALALALSCGISFNIALFLCEEMKSCLKANPQRYELRRPKREQRIVLPESPNVKVFRA